MLNEMEEETRFSFSDWLAAMKERFDVTSGKLNSNFISHIDNIFEIQTPAGELLILPPLEYSKNYGFALKLIGKDGVELSGDTRIKINKRKTNGMDVLIDDLLYYNIRYGHPTLYHPIKPLELNSLARLQFIIYSPDVDMELSRLDAVMYRFTPKDVFPPKPYRAAICYPGKKIYVKHVGFFKKISAFIRGR